MKILLCDTFPGLLPSCIPSYESMFIRLFESVRPGMNYEIIPTWQDVWPDRLDHNDIYLITGSNSDSYDEHTPWIVHLREWIVEAYAAGIRMAGICFGHQILAHALGGQAALHPGGWGTGIRPSTILEPSLAEAVGGRDLRLMYNHHDQVLRLPAAATCLATSSFCHYEAFAMGPHQVIAFQGHPEYIPEYARHLLLNHADHEDPAVCQAALGSLQCEQHHGHAVARYILDYLCPQVY